MTNEPERDVECLCPDQTCRSWFLTNAGLGFDDQGRPRRPNPARTEHDHDH